MIAQESTGNARHPRLRKCLRRWGKVGGDWGAFMTSFANEVARALSSVDQVSPGYSDSFDLMCRTWVSPGGADKKRVDYLQLVAEDGRGGEGYIPLPRYFFPFLAEQIGLHNAPDGGLIRGDGSWVIPRPQYDRMSDRSIFPKWSVNCVIYYGMRATHAVLDPAVRGFRADGRTLKSNESGNYRRSVWLDEAIVKPGKPFGRYYNAVAVTFAEVPYLLSNTQRMADFVLGAGSGDDGV